MATMVGGYCLFQERTSGVSPPNSLILLGLTLREMYPEEYLFALDKYMATPHTRNPWINVGSLLVMVAQVVAEAFLSVFLY